MLHHKMKARKVQILLARWCGKDIVWQVCIRTLCFAWRPRVIDTVGIFLSRRNSNHHSIFPSYDRQRSVSFKFVGVARPRSFSIVVVVVIVVVVYFVVVK